MEPAEIVASFKRRQRARQPLTATAEVILALYEGRHKVKRDELELDEHITVANLLMPAVDQTAARMGSTDPQYTFHPDRPNSKTAQAQARLRGQAIRGLRHANQTKLKRRQRFRWLISYGSGPVLLRPYRGSVIWQPRSPLSTYPAATSELDDMCPPDCIFTHTQTWWWLRTNFPEQAAMLRRRKDCTDDDEFTLLEHVDGDAFTLIALARDADMAVTTTTHGPTRNSRRAQYPTIETTTTNMPQVANMSGTQNWVVIKQTPNAAGYCTAVIPNRIGLEGPTGQFNQMVNLFMEQAVLNALEIDAIRESIYPQQWLEPIDPAQPVEVVVEPDPRTGRLGETKNGRINTINVQPGFQTYQTIDRLERAQRITAGIPADFGGESGTNIRTARRGAELLESAISFPIQEAQEIMARAEWFENRCAIGILRGEYPTRAQSFGAVWRGRGPAEWTAAKLFPSDRASEHDVRYPYPGSDANGQTIRSGQKVQTKMISLQTAREDDPEIDDPELERDRITAEQLEAAQLASLQQQAAQGIIPPDQLARITELVMSDRVELYAAIQQAQREAQELQASQFPAGAPETMPGLSMPGMGAEAGVAEGPPSSLEGMTRMLGALRLGQRASGPEQSAEYAARIGG